MLARIAGFLDTSTTVAAILLALLGLQVVTQLYALVDLARRDTVRGGRKWVWALVIALGNLPGAIGYLVAGRPPRAIDVSDNRSSATAVGADATRRAVDALYGPRDGR